MMDAGTLDFATFMNTMRNNDNSGFANGNNMWIWLLFMFFFWGGFGGNGMFGNGRMASAAEQQLSNDFIYSNLNSQIRGVNEGVIQGFSGLNTSMLQGIGSLDKSISSSTAFTGERINGLERGLCNLGYELKSSIDSCCCNTQKAIQQFGYENQLAVLNQTNTLNQSISAIGDKIDAQTAVMLKEFCNIKSREDARQIAELTAQLNDAKTANMMAAQTANLSAQLNQISCAIPKQPVPAYLAGNNNGYYGYYGFPYPYACNCGMTTITTGGGTTPAA